MANLKEQVEECFDDESVLHPPRKEVSADKVNKQKSRSNFENTYTNSISNNSQGFGTVNTTPGLRQTHTKPASQIHSEAFNTVTKTNNGTRKKKMIESAAALIMKDALKGRLAFERESQTWYKFADTHWRLLEVSQMADHLLLELLYLGTGSLGFTNAYKNSIKSILTDGNMLPIPKADHTKLPFVNGLLDLKTRALEPITPDNAQTWILPYSYQPDADCPNIKAYLTLAVDGNAESVKFLQAWMAAILHGRNDLQKFLHLKGAGGTGKGVFMRLITAMVGKRNTASTSLEQLERNKFEAACLYEKKLALISDSDKYGGSINNLKAITGQDHIRLERKHQQQSGSFVFRGMVVIASNESLQITDHTSGLDRRRTTVIFNRRATNEEKLQWETQGGEEAVLHTELPGLINWLLELSNDDISQIIRNPPARIRDADREAMQSTNSIADWVNECCEPDLNTWTQIGDKREIKKTGRETQYAYSDTRLYPNYLQWCQRQNKGAFSSRKFKEILIQTCETYGIEVSESRRGNGNGVLGLKLAIMAK